MTQKIEGLDSHWRCGSSDIVFITPGGRRYSESEISVTEEQLALDRLAGEPFNSRFRRGPRWNIIEGNLIIYPHTKNVLKEAKAKMAEEKTEDVTTNQNIRVIDLQAFLKGETLSRRSAYILETVFCVESHINDFSPVLLDIFRNSDNLQYNVKFQDIKIITFK